MPSRMFPPQRAAAHAQREKLLNAVADRPFRLYTQIGVSVPIRPSDTTVCSPGVQTLQPNVGRLLADQPGFGTEVPAAGQRVHVGW